MFPHLPITSVTFFWTLSHWYITFLKGSARSWSYYCHVGIIYTNRLLEIFRMSYKQCCCLYLPGMFNFSFLFCNTMTLLTYGQLIITTTTCKVFSIQLQSTRLFACLSLICTEDYYCIHTKTCAILLKLHSFSLVRANKYGEQIADRAGHGDSTVVYNTGRWNSIMPTARKKTFELFKTLLCSVSP